MLHSGAEEGGILEPVRIFEESETLGIDRRAAFLVEVLLEESHSTDGVEQSLGARNALRIVENLDLVEDVHSFLAVLALLEVRPDQVLLGMVRVPVPFVFRRVARPPLLCALETEGSEDGRLDLLERGGVGHLESVCRLVGLPGVDYRLVNF